MRAVIDDAATEGKTVSSARGTLIEAA